VVPEVDTWDNGEQRRADVLTAVLPLKLAQTAVFSSVFEGRVDDPHPTGTSTSAAPIKAP